MLKNLIHHPLDLHIDRLLGVEVIRIWLCLCLCLVCAAMLFQVDRIPSGYIMKKYITSDMAMI